MQGCIGEDRTDKRFSVKDCGKSIEKTKGSADIRKGTSFRDRRCTGIRILGAAAILYKIFIVFSQIPFTIGSYMDRRIDLSITF